MQYSPDGRDWTDGPETSVFNAIREGGPPNLWDPLDVPDRRIKAYGRVYTANARSCGVMWSSDLLHWGGVGALPGPGPPIRHAAGGDPRRSAASPSLSGCLRRERGGPALLLRSEYCRGSVSVRLLAVHVRSPQDFALAVSRDGLNFTRVKNGESTLPAGPLGAWDSYGSHEQVAPARR